jgi:hypothetical protein
LLDERLADGRMVTSTVRRLERTAEDSRECESWNCRCLANARASYVAGVLGIERRRAAQWGASGSQDNSGPCVGLGVRDDVMPTRTSSNAIRDARPRPAPCAWAGPVTVRRWAEGRGPAAGRGELEAGALGEHWRLAAGREVTR